MPITGIRLKKGSLYRGKTNRLQSEKIATDYFFHKSKRDRPQKISFGSASLLVKSQLFWLSASFSVPSPYLSQNHFSPFLKFKYAGNLIPPGPALRPQVTCPQAYFTVTNWLPSPILGCSAASVPVYVSCDSGTPSFTR